MLLREPLQTSFDDVADYDGRIKIYHPAYTGRVLLLALAGKDSPSGAIYFDVALLACAIVADNRFDGYLSTSRDTPAAPVPDSELLEPGRYFFHVPAPDTTSSTTPFCYPVVPTFRSWTFPHDDPLFGKWKRIWEGALPEADGRHAMNQCVVTSHQLAIDNSHIVPDAETQWFIDNEMSDFLDRRATSLQNPVQQMTNARNMLALRADIHRLWDAKEFVFFPKLDDSEKQHMVVHCVSADHELATRFHNRRLPLMRGASWACLFTRFAWSLFPLHTFLSGDGTRLLRVYSEEEKSWKEARFDSTSRARLAVRIRSTSPKKRAQSQMAKDGGQQDSVEPSCEDDRWYFDDQCCKRLRRSFDSGYVGGYSQDEELRDWPPRGRSRTRRV